MHYLVYHLNRAQAELLQEKDLDAIEQKAYARRGSRYLLMRSLLKHELARLTGKDAATIRFTYGMHGKPAYTPQPFNMSHSGDVLCLAFHHSDIGVDIERIGKREHMAALARRIMCPPQFAAWQQRQSNAEEFYACWCTAEALAKQCGGSVWQAQQRPFLWHSSGIEPLYESAPRVELFTPTEGYQGAVAYHP